MKKIFVVLLIFSIILITSFNYDKYGSVEKFISPLSFYQDVIHFGIQKGDNVRLFNNGLTFISNNHNILSSQYGKVEFVGYNQIYGNYIIIQHENSLKTVYTKLNHIFIQKDQDIKRGQKIADIETDKFHLKVLQNNNIINPEVYIKL